MEWNIYSHSPEETGELGRYIGEMLKGGDVICLKGDLGAGKTAFAKGIGLGLGVEEPMTSPTFSFLHEYIVNKEGRSLKLVHMDLYRLRQPEEAEVIGIEDHFQEDTICLIEWPEIAEYLLPRNYLEINIEGSGELRRTFSFEALQGEWESRFKGLFDQFHKS